MASATNRRRKGLQKINDDAFDGSFTLEETKYLVHLGEKRASELSRNASEKKEEDSLKIEYYKEKYLEMLAGNPKSKKRLLAHLLKIDGNQSEKDKKIHTKNKFNNFEGRNYDWNELEQQLLNL